MKCLKMTELESVSEAAQGRIEQKRSVGEQGNSDVG